MSDIEEFSQKILQPQLARGDELKITKKIYFTLPCPKCDKDLNVTGLSAGRNVTCPSCGNVTILPDFKPRWWFRIRNFTLSILLSFIIGFLASFVATHIYEKVVITQNVQK